jgi:hypothetical protein
MDSIAVFRFDSQDVRFIDGKPVANDVARVLGYSDPAKTVSTKVDSDYKGVTKMVTPGGTQTVTVLEEPGIYQLVFGSKLSSAKKFQRWVFEEVLPSIRKTGSYGTTRPLAAYSERVKMMYESAQHIPDGYWCVLHESAYLLIIVENKYGDSVNKADLLDGSIGKRWSSYRKGKDWAVDRIEFVYTFPDGRVCRPWCYRNQELLEFRDWIRNEYSTLYLHEYLVSKYGSAISAIAG